MSIRRLQTQVAVVRRPYPALLALCYLAFALPAAPLAAPQPAALAMATTSDPDSRQMEQDLQHLNWERFRFVIESVPELKSGVDRYGPLGWEFLKSRYQTYGWKRNIDRLEPGERHRLAALIQRVKSFDHRSGQGR
jgi:hypothetical protein